MRSAVGKIQVRATDRVLELTLADPATGNRLDATMVSGLLEAVESGIRQGQEILVLRADGPVFSVGRPRAQPQRQPDADAPAGASDGGPEGLQEQLAALMRLNLALGDWPGVSVAAVRGGAWGAAAGLVVHCDVVLAEENARFGFPEITYGLPPALVNSYLTKWLPARGAHYLVLTGQEIAARTAHAWGMVSEVVQTGGLEERLGALVEALQASAPGSLRLCKETLLQYRSMSEAEAAPLGIDRVVQWVRARQGRGPSP